MERGSRVSSGRVQPILPVLCLPLSSPVFAWALLGLQCISKNVREGCKAKRSTEPRFLSALFQPIANLPLIAGPLPLRMQASGRKHREGAVTRSIRRSSILLRGAGLCVLLSLIAQSTAQNFNLPELEEYTQPDQCPALMALRQVKQVSTSACRQRCTPQSTLPSPTRTALALLEENPCYVGVLVAHSRQPMGPRCAPSAPRQRRVLWWQPALMHCPFPSAARRRLFRG